MPQDYTQLNAGVREDLGDVYWKSGWEANYARYLTWLVSHGQIQSWEYEPTTFWFEGIKRGTTSYKPDFRVVRTDGREYYVEVKGRIDGKHRTKMRRMAKYHPTVELVVVDARDYRILQSRVGALVPKWEFPNHSKFVPARRVPGYVRSNPRRRTRIRQRR